MAQSALTVTPPNPTYPSNFSSTGVTGPNPPNLTKINYANPFNLTLLAGGAVNSPQLATDGRPQSPYGVNPSPPPYYDDGTAGTATVFATNVAALAGGTGATSGGTEGTYPGTDTAPFDTPNMVGAVPASTSVAHEGAGTEVLVTQTYSSAIFLPAGPLLTVSTGPTLTANAMPQPNRDHASSLSKATLPGLTSATPGNTTAGAGNTTLAVVGTNFTPQSVVYYNGVAYPTVFVSATSLTVAAVPKKTSAGTIPVYVITGGVVTTAGVNATYV
jgi:hypothetical protein